MTSRYNLVVCELFNSLIHGIDMYSTRGIEGHFLCLICFNHEDEYHLSEIMYNNAITTMIPNDLHPTVRNYHNIIETMSMYQIGEVVIAGSGEESVVILKTFWLNIFKRHWRKYIEQKRRTLLYVAKNPYAFMFREIYGGAWFRRQVMLHDTNFPHDFQDE